MAARTRNFFGNEINQTDRHMDPQTAGDDVMAVYWRPVIYVNIIDME